MIPADSKDVKKEYQILINELKEYNPELLDKNRLLAITKSDLLDAELMQELKKELPTELGHVFISSLTQYNINELKDMIWKAINA